MNPTVIVVLIIIVCLLILFLVPNIMLRRAFAQVIGIFLKNNITHERAARTAEELKLNKKSYFISQMTTRDYKPAALNALIENGIVISTDDGKLYLSEQALSNSPLSKRIKLPKRYGA